MNQAGLLVGMQWEASTLSGLRTASGARCAVSGPGAERAEAAADRLLSAGLPALVSWGVATALTAELRPGSVLVPAVVHDAAGTALHTDAGWRQALLARLGGGADCDLAETGEVLNDSGARRRLHERTGAGAADMESAAVLRSARAHGVPGLVVRVVLDPLERALAAGWADTITPAGAIHSAAVARLLCSPANWPAALALARDRRAATRALRRTARDGGDTLLTGFTTA